MKTQVAFLMGTDKHCASSEGEELLQRRLPKHLSSRLAWKSKLQKPSHRIPIATRWIWNELARLCFGWGRVRPHKILNEKCIGREILDPRRSLRESESGQEWMVLQRPLQSPNSLQDVSSTFNRPWYTFRQVKPKCVLEIKKRTSVTAKEFLINNSSERH
jgi:hypothetical protein